MLTGLGKLVGLVSIVFLYNLAILGRAVSLSILIVISDLISQVGLVFPSILLILVSRLALQHG